MSLEYFIFMLYLSVNCTTVNWNASPQASQPLKKWDWLTFSCSCAKSHISVGPVQHVEDLTLLSCQKVQEKKVQLLHGLGWSHGGNPSLGNGDVEREQTRGYPAVPQPNCWDDLHAVCVRATANIWISVNVIYPSAFLPGYQHSQLHHADMSFKPA